MIDSIKTVACLAWAAVAISSATPAHALARFNLEHGYGDYASCSASWTPLETYEVCGYYLNYAQTIKLVTEGCDQGGCSPHQDYVSVESVYSPNRKPAELVYECAMNIFYALGDCSC